MSYLLALLRRHIESVCPCRAASQWVTPSPPTVSVADHSGATCWPEADSEPAILPLQTHWEARAEIRVNCSSFALFDHEESLSQLVSLLKQQQTDFISV